MAKTPWQDTPGAVRARNKERLELDIIAAIVYEDEQRYYHAKKQLEVFHETE